MNLGRERTSSGFALTHKGERLDFQRSPDGWRLVFLSDWSKVRAFVADGFLREVCYGPSTFNHVERFLADDAQAPH